MGMRLEMKEEAFRWLPAPKGNGNHPKSKRQIIQMASATAITITKEAKINRTGRWNRVSKRITDTEGKPSQ